MTESQQRTLLTRYLLGEVSDEERAGIEERYLGSDDLFEELVAAENDLVDAYVHGKLGLDQKQFETYFLSSPERRERVEFAKSLMQHNSARTQSDAVSHEHLDLSTRAGTVWLRGAPLGVRLALATFLVVAAVAASWLAITNRTLRHQLETLRSAQAESQRQAEQLRQQIAELQEATAATGQTQQVLPLPGAAIVALSLTSDISRTPEHQQIVLPLSRGIAEARLLLKTGRINGATYEVILETAEGARVWKKAGLPSLPEPSGGSMVTITLSPHLLRRDDYVVRLFRAISGGKTEEVGSYSFRVTK